MSTLICFFSGGYEADEGNRVSVVDLLRMDQIQRVKEALVSLHLRDTALKTAPGNKEKGWTHLEIQLLSLGSSSARMKEAKAFIMNEIKK